MIRDLRLRFIRITMISFLAVLLVILTAVNLVHRYSVYAELDTRLSYLADSTLGPPEGMLASTPPEVRSWLEQNTAGIMDRTSYFIFSGYMTSDVLAYQTDALSRQTGQDAAQLIADILAGTRARGNVGAYRYYAASREEPYRLVFLRCENEFSAMRSLWRISVAVGLAGFALVLLLVSLLSGRVMRPFARNAENQKRFISNASHELKTPLGVIMADLDMQVMEGGRSEWLSNAMIQADHLAMLIEQLTAYSLLDEKRQRAESVPVDISQLGESIQADFQPLARSKGQTLKADITPGVTVRGDGDAFRTLLSVLMDNAVKYTPDGGGIQLSIRREKRAVIELVNTCGTEELELPQLFERFYRAPRHRADQDGHGLGLSIASEIVSMYDGVIRAESRPDGAVAFIAEF